MKRTGLMGLLIAVAVPTSAGEVSSKEAATAELSKAVQDYMLATYACQDYLGGLAMYRAAKLTTEGIMVKIGVDRNTAVLMTQRTEDNLKAQKPHIAMEEARKKSGMSKRDAEAGCNESVAQEQERVKLLQAKLGLL